jgi:L-arabinose isomerase
MPKPLPRIGLILLRAEWFDSVVAMPALVEAIQTDEAGLLQALRPHFEIAGAWGVNSAESLAHCIQQLNAADLDLVVLAFQVWAEDYTIKPLLAAIGDRPLAVWCYLPWEHPPRPASFLDVLRGSGPVGTFEGLGTIRNLGKPFTFTYGAPTQPRLIRDLQIAADAAGVRKQLRQARFGLLPSHNEQMQSTFVDEFRLQAGLGPLVQYFSVADLQRAMEKLPEAEVQAFAAQQQSDYPVKGIKENTLQSSARASLGVARLAAAAHLDLISVNDISSELHEALGLRPCLYPDLFDEAGVLVGLEGDLGAATAMFILNRFSGAPVFFAEFWFWDEAENLMVGGHAGFQNPHLAAPGKIWISHDYEYAQSDRLEGAHYQFITRPGRVTLLQLRGTPTGWQAILVPGEALAGEPWLDSYPHAIVHPDGGIAHFLRVIGEVGATQHWAMTYGDFAPEVTALCKLLNVPLAIVN